MMVKKWLPTTPLGIVDYGRAQFASKEDCDDFILRSTGCPPGLLFESTELDVNVDPITEVGIELQQKIRDEISDSKTISFHMSLGPDFLKFSPDEKMQFIYDMLTIRGEPVNFGDQTLDRDL